MVSTYSSVTLDIIGVAALGIEFQNLDAPTPFHECYHRVFDPPLLGQILLTANAFVPVRWIPLEENRRFTAANAEVQRLMRQIVRQRIEDVAAGYGSTGAGDRRDLLTYIIEETNATGQPWTEEELLGHVRRKAKRTYMPSTRDGTGRRQADQRSPPSLCRC